MIIETVRTTTAAEPRPQPSPRSEAQAPADSVVLSDASRQAEPPADPAKPPDSNKPSAPPFSPEEMVRLSGELAATGRELKPGERILVKVDGQTVAEVSKEGVDRWTSLKTAVADTAQGLVSAANSAMQEDPSFTFREAIQVARSRMLNSDIEGLKDITLKGLVPATRTIALMLDVYRAQKTFTHPEATFIDKFIDGGHVVTDVAGVVGALPEVLPALKAVPGIQGFLIAAVVGDIMAFGYHCLRWFRQTGNRPFPVAPEQKQDQGQPQSSPQKPQVRVNLGGVSTVTPLLATAETLRSHVG